MSVPAALRLIVRRGPDECHAREGGQTHSDVQAPKCEPGSPQLYKGPGAPLDDLREAVTTGEDTARIARRVLGGAHPITMGIEKALRFARAALRARETPSGSA